MLDLSVLVVALLAFALNWFAYRKGFYRFTESRPNLPITLFDLVCLFAIYLLFSMMLAPVFAKLYLKYLNFVNPEVTTLSVLAIGVIQLVTMTVILLSLLLFLSIRNAPLLRRIWKDRTKNSSSILVDFSLGVVAWFLAFPIVVVISHLCDSLIDLLFGPQRYEQAAVHFVKTAMQQTDALALSMVSVMFFAPVVEEFLFRGALQNFLKNYFGRKMAISLSALCFSLFHLTLSQGLGNFSLAVSLFILGLFLGFLYERQGSLFASIGLHMTFNVISAVRILLSTEG